MIGEQGPEIYLPKPGDLFVAMLGPDAISNDIDELIGDDEDER